MAMLRVSSYRRLFEEEQWTRGMAPPWCVEGSTAPWPGGAVDAQWAEPDFEAARTVNREAVSRYVRERALIAALNDRLAFLIKTARCLEEDNESLEAQILELEEMRGTEDTMAASTSAAVPDYSLQGVVESLQREKEQILCKTEELRKELAVLQARHQAAAEQRTLVQLERDDVAVDVDILTTECLALRDQAAIFERQLDRLQEEQETNIETLVTPDDRVAMVTMEFPTPDVTPAILDIKEYYCQLAESLQFESKAATAVVLRDPKQGEVTTIPGAKVADVSKMTDIDELRSLIVELQKELADLQKHGEELEVEIEERKEVHLDEIAELECCVAELKGDRAELEAQMQEQCGDYEELLSEKMALDIEITAYRGLVEEEEGRLCYL